ncbi:carboxymuconolactone decarboxylase family protein [Heminiphilus faecis]|uniref:Carboxymuconolactone decarboxylase family protein n=1 Tax=Heminiphilus faecis TaxID=2601703 RepID=A0ABV4CYD9_9BACT|nr:carboxymuconolactone decarboxylase family protein [Xylanibacter rodentium]
MAITIAFSTVAQDFRQPYPIGTALKDNPNFIGQAYLSPVTKVKNLNVPMFNVTFEPGCRNSWHRHSGGQLLIATAGIGYYQEKEKPARRLSPGDIVEIAPGVEHWHGAAPDSWFAHLAVECNPDSNEVTWLDPVNDADYLSATTAEADKYAVENKVLNKRQQAIVAIASYTGNGDLEHLEDALTQGLDAGMTVNEIKEILVQAYAYAGFPRSLRGIQTFMSLLDKRKAAGIKDVEGREATPIKEMTDSEKYTLGKRTLAELSGIPADSPIKGYSAFAPIIDKFLKEHLFTDIFDRDILTWKDRELATVSILAGVGKVEPMAYGHMGICLNLGITPAQLAALLNIIEINLGPEYSDPLREVLANVSKN